MIKLNKLKISIIIPTYNRSQTIEYCVRSVLNQTYQNFEIIVVDDCSIDNTVEVAGKIKDDRIKIFSLDKNSGAQVARNKGIKEADSEWITFLDSDDEYLPNKLELQIKELEKNKFDKYIVVHGNCNTLEYKSNKESYWQLPLVEDESYKKLLSHPAPVFPAILTSKKALEEVGYLDENVPSYQEWETSIRLAKLCKFIHIQKPLFIYHLHSGETISKDLFRDFIGYQYILDKYKDEIIKECGDIVWQNHLKIQYNKILNENIFVLNKLGKLEQKLLNSFFTDFNNYTSQLEIDKREIERKYKLIENSKSFKFGSFLLKPFKIIRKIF